MGAAGQLEIASASVEERHLTVGPLRRAAGSHRASQRCSIGIVGAQPVVLTDHDDAVVIACPLPRHLSVAYVCEHPLGLPLKWVTPPAAAGCPDLGELPGPHRLGVGERVGLPLVRATRIDRDLEWTAGEAAADPPTRQDRSIRDRHEEAVTQDTDVLLVPEATAE